MAERHLRTAQRKRRARAKFWDQNAERVRLALIGGAVVVVVTLIAKVALG